MGLNRLLVFVISSLLASNAAVAQPGNDDACNAIAALLGTPTPFDNTDAGAQVGEVNPGAGTGGSSCQSQDGWCAGEPEVQASVWYKFVAPASGCVNVDTDNILDLQLAVWRVGNCGDFSTFQELAANDDSGNDSEEGFSPYIDTLTGLVSGSEYFIQLDSLAFLRGSGAVIAGNKGSGNILVTECPPRLSVAVDDCQTRIVKDLDDINDINYLHAIPSGGLPPYNCVWSVESGDMESIIDDPLCDSCNAAVQPDADTTYCVQVIDSNNESVEACVDVDVVDVSCGTTRKKVELCHFPQGKKNNNGRSLCIAAAAVPVHLSTHSGDKVGPCDRDITCSTTHEGCGAL